MQTPFVARLHTGFRYLLGAAFAAAALSVSACSLTGVGQVVGNNAPTSGNINDDASAARFVPDLPGYISTDAVSVTQAFGTVAGGASLITGNPLIAALVSQVDGVIDCYRATGSVAAKVYVDQNISQLMQGDIPSFGTLAVVNQNRIVDNFLPCVVGNGPDTMSAQAAAIQPCGETGSFVVNNETLLYVIAGSRPEMCITLKALLPAGSG